LYYLKTNNPDWEQWMTYTKHKSITSFNARDEQIAETIWQQCNIIDIRLDLVTNAMFYF